MPDRTPPTPKSPADVDRIIEQFSHSYGRQPTSEEMAILEWLRQLLADQQCAADKAAAD